MGFLVFYKGKIVQKTRFRGVCAPQARKIFACGAKKSFFGLEFLCKSCAQCLRGLEFLCDQNELISVMNTVFNKVIMFIIGDRIQCKLCGGVEVALISNMYWWKIPNVFSHPNVSRGGDLWSVPHELVKTYTV